MAKRNKNDETEPQKLAGVESDDTSKLIESRPKDLPIEEIGLTTEEMNETAPIIPPPGEFVEESYTAGITAWHNSQNISGLWSINENRNSWALIAGVGWRKLANGSDSGIVALTMLASHAKQLQSKINYREETDAMIHEMYVW
ncbi:MAG: hypothetical protein KDC52_06125 [Ignavibacteriae bacterium]|nr:hypothetical protein [Ignavibacteriota bacterium]MCB0751032.1 hypothetical protein [Ignavibacteriota bacterium]MCB9250755.1 hypothetical protein [Ignavibacteriales bacterium]